MNSAQTHSAMLTGSPKANGRLVTIAAIAAGLFVIVLVGAAVITALGAKGATSTRDRLADPQAIAFRQSEHESAVRPDPLAAPAIVKFRQSERASSYRTDALAGSAAVGFRNTERAENYKSTGSDPLAAPNLVKFRSSEHSEAGR
jgi:hypothetical protein